MCWMDAGLDWIGLDWTRPDCTGPDRAEHAAAAGGGESCHGLSNVGLPHHTVREALAKRVKFGTTRE